MTEPMSNVDFPLELTDEQAAVVIAWLDDQAKTWANVGDRPMCSAIEDLRREVSGEWAE